METGNERKKNLNDLLLLIERCAAYEEVHFDKLHEKLQDQLKQEISRTNGKRNTYLDNLQQTLDKQVADYKEAEPNFKQVEYFRFLKALREDIKDELERIEKYG